MVRRPPIDAAKAAGRTDRRQIMSKVKMVGKSGLWEDLHFERERFRIMRKIVAHITAKSWEEIPHAAFVYEPDATRFLEEYKTLKANNLPGRNITFNSLMLKTMIEGLKAAPHLNAYLQYNTRSSRGSIDTISEINISMPCNVDEGNTITVNIQNTNEMTLAQINDAVADIRRRAANTHLDELYYKVAFKQSMEDLKKLKVLTVVRRLFAGRVGKDKVHPLTGKAKKEYYRIPETDRLTIKDVRQGTVIITNVGSIARSSPLTMTLLEIIPPQVVAIAIANAQEKPGVVAGENGEKTVAPRMFLPISVALDHRAFDFDAMVPFIAKLDEIFAAPEIMHSW